MAQTIKILVDGGKASAGPPLGPALGPTGINVGAVVAKINEKTKDFSGMKVPVEVIIDTATKSFDIKTGSPPVSQLIMKEIGVEKLAANPKLEKVGNLAIEQVIKIANSKIDSFNCTSMKSATKTVIGSCVSIGVLVEGMEPQEATKAVNAGKFDKEISGLKTEVSSEKKAKMAADFADKKAKLAKVLEAMKAEAAAAAAAAPVAEAKVDAEGKAAAPAAGADKKAAAAPGAKAAAPAAAAAKPDAKKEAKK